MVLMSDLASLYDFSLTSQI